MLEIEEGAWEVMMGHAVRLYPEECCGAMVGRIVSGRKVVSRAVPLDNVYAGPRHARYEVRTSDLVTVDSAARRDGLALIGIYHSHPDSRPEFSPTDLGNSCPWYSFVILSIRQGRFDGARSWVPDADQTAAEEEDLRYPGSGNSKVSDAQ